MKVKLSPSYELSDEHAANSYEQPVLVNRASGGVFGPGDIFQPYPSWPYQTASKAVERLVRTREFTYDEQAFVDKFVNFGK